ncbi:hypothetical protein ARAM_005422 [Aspergillus rambellii]|uniref:Lytic polysaccharide monooxygenase n=3 Tax=Aspergillus subgen. Nidulantes TaxID=2720870 RepID=A0A0F8XSB6_9EURO|nr:hypothetical protein AOCH_004045 [Aspergillus ochraceoroseus]KKK26422.1 hypothetical protein ARAM_005422 [Aspergillus rambellii]
MFPKSALSIVAVLGASLVGAHQEMVKPVPYNYVPNKIDNSPLLADGSNFPCKITGDYSVTTENMMAVGESQELAFVGTAVHGGGSCQISITSDRAPTKDTKWSVIKSIEGGCVADVDGNLSGEGASTANPYTFNFTIPEGVEAGKYTMAWTWFNRVGNREMYMNCAPITVTTGSSSKRSEGKEVKKRALDGYPDMFIANINGCQTAGNKDIRFPVPGDVIEYLGKPANLIGEDVNVCDEGSPTWGTAGYSTASGSVPEPTASTSTSTSQPSVSASATVSVPVPDTTPETTQPSEPGTSVPSSTSAAPTPSSSSSSSGVLTGACSNEGLWNCIGGTSFQRCASGIWSETQSVAAGTECIPGQSADFTVKAIAMKPRMLKERRFRKRSHAGHVHA